MRYYLLYYISTIIDETETKEFPDHTKAEKREVQDLGPTHDTERLSRAKSEVRVMHIYVYTHVYIYKIQVYTCLDKINIFILKNCLKIFEIFKL